MLDGDPLTHLLLAQRRPFLIIDQNHRILRGNGALEAELGFAAASLVGQPCCHLDSAPGEQCRHQRFFQDLEPYVETRAIKTADGLVRFARLQGFPVIDARGGVQLGESIQLVDHQPDVGTIVGSSPARLTLLRQLMQAAATEAAVLLNGETGSGKELAAQFIHQHSQRRSRAFVVVDCTVLSEDLFESELFGHVKGAFTGAVGAKVGLMELADGGTLFLDEIGELPLSQQPKLLRALETGTYRPVGATTTRHANVRVVSATHRNLQIQARDGLFRQDLYYRLAVLPLSLPSLRERRADIPELADHLLAGLSAADGQPYRLSAAALRKLMAYEYPGNIRELRNLLHLGAALSPGGTIDVDAIHLPEALVERRRTASVGFQVGAGPVAPIAGPTQLPSAAADIPDSERLSPVELAEARYILGLMQQHRGSRKDVAARMAVSERTLYRKLKRYHLNRAEEPQHREHATND